MRLFKQVLLNALERPVTRRYPLERREPHPGSRGHIEMELAPCTSCGLCQRRCPTDAIKVSKTPKNWSLDPHLCIVCGFCVEVCPPKCIKMNAAHRKPSA